MSFTENTIRGLLEHAAQAHGGQRGISLLDRRGNPGPKRTYAELLHASQATAATLLAEPRLSPGQPIILCLPTSWEYLRLWFGSVLAGYLPVSIAPPLALGSSHAPLQRLVDLTQHMGASLCVAQASTLKAAHEASSPELPEFAKWADASLTPEQLPEAASAHPEDLPTLQPEQIAFLQLTSGSTGRSRAVMISHGSAVANTLAIGVATSAPHGKVLKEVVERCVCWLPMHHDMGLVGCLLSSLATGIDLDLATPKSFLGRPEIWLRNLGRPQASGGSTTCSPAPNFAYQTCVERLELERLPDVDLSSWKAALVGAEMIRPETMDAFADKFAPLGFDARNYRPCYGMAEATLALTMDMVGAGVRTHPIPPELSADLSPGEQGRAVCVGAPVMETELRISPSGEVQARGSSIFSGYWNDPQATAEALKEGWLCTGDLGFLHEGELYITGRAKDLIIVNGHNVMPHEIEWAAESVTGGGGAHRAGAFAVSASDGSEQPVLVVELPNPEPEPGLEQAIRTRLAEQFALPLADLVLVRRGRLPKTTSGKIQRSQLRRNYEAGDLERLN